MHWVDFLETGGKDRLSTLFALVASRKVAPLNLLYSKDPSLSPDVVRKIREAEVLPALEQSIWNTVGREADRFNEPGRFTTFIGYEWTSMPDGNNLHRKVLFRDNAELTSKTVPFSSTDGDDPAELWQYLDSYERTTGGRVMAIPHNGNLSNGLMFAEISLDGKALTRDYAQRRSRWERVVEVTQIKGDGETHPFLSPNDEFANFETWDRVNIAMNTPKSQSMLQYEYTRSALKIGLAVEKSTGINPFAFGMIGSTDSHSGLSTADEDNFFGKFSKDGPAKNRADGEYIPGAALAFRYGDNVASGYTGIWARENTREALFDALYRRETYATTGPRIRVRFFGGWSFAENDHFRPDFSYHGYRNGVPMGSSLLPTDDNAAPRFMVSAFKDPLGANLDRIQIVKGWIDENGSTHEKVYNVAASDSRPILNNTLQSVGSTVDVEGASYRNSIGDAGLSTVWQDPAFDPMQKAFYYVRVLEIPTPRWTTIDARVLGSALPSNVPASIQERAYTSPIWYHPAAKTGRIERNTDG